MFAKQRDDKNNYNMVNGPLANTIGKDTTIEGEIKTEGNLRIDGKVIGIVKSKAKVVLGPTGSIDGDLHCSSADVAGKVNGKIQVIDILHLKGTATTNGDIVTGKIVVEAEAKILGSMDVGGLKKSNTVNAGEQSKVYQREAV